MVFLCDRVQYEVEKRRGNEIREDNMQATESSIDLKCFS